MTFYQSILNNSSESERKIVVKGFELLIDSISKSTCEKNEKNKS